MRRFLLTAAALLTACAQPIVDDTVLPEPPPDEEPTDRPTPTFVPPPEPMYFVARAGVTHLRRHSAAFGAKPRRLSPQRGAVYGRGAGSIEFVGLTPAERLAILWFRPRGSSTAGGFYAVALDGFAPDEPVLIADGVFEPTLFHITDDRMAYVDRGIARVVHLDGRDSSAPVAIMPMGTDSSTIRIRIVGAWLAIEARQRSNFETTLEFFPIDATSGATPIRFLNGQSSVEGVLPDGRPIIATAGGLAALDLDTQVSMPIAQQSSVIGIAGIGDTLITSRADRAGTTIEAVRVDGENIATRHLVTVPDINAVEISADGRWVFAMSWNNNEYDVLRVSVAGTPMVDVVIGQATLTTERSLFPAHDGRFALLCVDSDLVRYDGVTGPKQFFGACRGRRLVGMSADDRTAILSSSSVLVLVSLEDGATEIRERIGALTAFSDGVLDTATSPGESTLYRVDRVGRTERLMPWSAPAIDNCYVVGDRIIYEQDDTWFAIPTSRGPPQRIASPPTTSRYVGVTGDFLVISVPNRFLTYPLDGSSPDEAFTEIEESTSFVQAGVGAGYLYYFDGQHVAAVPVNAGPDAVVGILTEAEFGIGPVLADPEKAQLIFAHRDAIGISVFRAALDGSQTERIVGPLPVRGGITPLGFQKVPNGRTAILTTYFNDIQPTLDDIFSIPLDATEVSTAQTIGGRQQALFGTNPFVANGLSVLLASSDGLRNVPTSGGQGVFLHSAPVERLYPGLVSPDQEWVLARAQSGALVIPTSTRNGEAITFAESAEAADFAPDGTIIYSAFPSEGIGPALFSTTLGLDESPRRLTPANFGIASIVRTDTAGVVVISPNGGDSSYYYVGYDGQRPIPLTPIDDADERLIARVTSD